jgi:hypothetical protein
MDPNRENKNPINNYKTNNSYFINKISPSLDLERQSK